MLENRRGNCVKDAQKNHWEVVQQETKTTQPLDVGLTSDPPIAARRLRKGWGKGPGGRGEEKADQVVKPGRRRHLGTERRTMEKKLAEKPPENPRRKGCDPDDLFARGGYPKSVRTSPEIVRGRPPISKKQRKKSGEKSRRKKRAPLSRGTES